MSCGAGRERTLLGLQSEFFRSSTSEALCLPVASLPIDSSSLGWTLVGLQNRR